jgi:hypothetical protein
VRTLVTSTIFMSVAALSLAATPAAAAGRACADNFSESGDRNTGKSFKSFLETEGNLTAAFQAVGRAIASDGWAGISASKDLGLVSGYQETNGKRSPINATVSELQPGRIRVDIVFQLAPGLASPAAAVKDGLCKILESVLSADQRAAAAAQSSISLKNETGEAALVMMAGALRQSGVFPVLKIYSDIEGTQSPARTRQRQPVLLVRESDDPSKKYQLVKLTPDESGNRRALKMMSGGKLIKAAFTGKVDYAPDVDWTIEFTSQQETTGIWRVSPRTDLEPGEYGLWDLQGMALAPFGVDN